MGDHMREELATITTDLILKAAQRYREVAPAQYKAMLDAVTNAADGVQ